MMVTDKDDTLDSFFDAARRSDATPQDDLMARVMADAAMVSAQRDVPAVTAPSSLSIWVRIVETIGGWPALGGVMAAGIGGLWIGVAPPANVEDWAANLVGNIETVSIYMDVDDVALEAQDG